MKPQITFFVLYCIIGITSYTFSQPKIKFNTTTFDFGTVLESEQTLYAIYKVTNIGTQPLIISNVQTSGGGLSGDWSTRPIMPGKRAEVILKYDGRRIGQINKTAYVSSNAINQERAELKVWGNIISGRTRIDVRNKQTDIGTIPFGAVDSISFLVINTGEAPLKFKAVSNQENVTPIDLFYISYTYHKFKNSIKNPVETLNYVKEVVNPNDTIRVQICLRNTLGDVGQKERHFYFKYNKDDTLKYTIKVNYTGAPGKHKLYEKNNLNDHSLYEYENGQIKKHTTYVRGHARTIYYFKDGDLIRAIDIHPLDGKQTEYNYKNGLIIDKKEIKNKIKRN